MKRKTNKPVMWISLPNNTLACACSSIQWNGYSLLPATGYRNYSSGVGASRGSYGYYWSAETEGTFSPRLLFGSSSASIYTDSRANSLSVRCVQVFTKSCLKIKTGCQANNPANFIIPEEKRKNLPATYQVSNRLHYNKENRQQYNIL